MLLYECLISNVNLNDNARVYVFVQVRVILFDKMPVGPVDLCLRCVVRDAKYLVGASVWPDACRGLLSCLLLSCLVRAISPSGVHVAVFVALADILLFDLVALSPHAVFVPGVDSLALAAFDSPDSEMRFACHSSLSSPTRLLRL